MEKIRRHYIFHGTVQGVGFRWHAAYSARRYGVTGWVKNRWDGTVEMEAEGTREDLSAMEVSLGQLRYGQIDSIDAKTVPLQDDSSFEIL